MIEGPYSRNRWQERLLGAASLLELLQALLFLLGFIALGAYWLWQAEYVKFGIVYGVAAALLYAAIRTRNLRVVILLVIWCVCSAFVGLST